MDLQYADGLGELAPPRQIPGGEGEGLAGQRQRGTVKSYGGTLVVVMKRVFGRLAHLLRGFLAPDAGVPHAIKIVTDQSQPG